MNDPAFLFYSSDFLTGCMDLTMEERGQYITLMCLQHQKGHLSEKTIRLSLGSVSVDVLSKFKKDEDGLLFNTRLDEEIEKRQNFVETRRQNGSLGGRPKKPLGLPNAKPRGKPKKNLIENDNINEIINYLNSKLNSNYKTNTAKTRELIIARFNNGFNVENFKKVIDIKHKEWNNTDMAKYLRPETLFGNKFESYLNQKESNKQDKVSNRFQSGSIPQDVEELYDNM